jgi:aspartyl-tRNA(Asn)/glutamyl-tRNA(Gln) amidotransferase subunit C
MAALTPEQVASVAHLARLSLSPDEARAYGVSLSRIMTLVEQLNTADTTGVEPMSHPLPGLQARLRPDAVTESDHHVDYQRNASEVDGGLYLVPKVIE